MQIASENGNRIGRADGGRDMLISELKLDKISRGYVSQGERVEKRKNSLHQRNQKRKMSQDRSCQGGKGMETTWLWTPPARKAAASRETQVHRGAMTCEGHGGVLIVNCGNRHYVTRMSVYSFRNFREGKRKSATLIGQQDQ